MYSNLYNRFERSHSCLYNDFLVFLRIPEAIDELLLANNEDSLL